MRRFKPTAKAPQTRYPHLFREVIWPWGPIEARFELRETAPPGHLIANVNVVGVEAVSIETAVKRFTAIGRHDLADLYRLAADIGAA